MPAELLNLKPNPDAPVLICFANAGGSSLVFRNWGKPLMNDLDLWALQLPARPFSRDNAPAWASIMAGVIDAAHLITTKIGKRPYAFLGHSMGALVAFETARQLRRTNAPLPHHLFLSSHVAPHLSKPATSLRKKPVAQMSDFELKTMLRSFAGTPDAILQDQELMALWLPTVRSDFDLLDRYNYQPEAPLAVKMVALGGKDDQQEAPSEGLQAWQTHCSQAVPLHLLPGGHFYLETAAAQLHALLRNYLLPEVAY